MPGGLAPSYAPWFGDPSLWLKPGLPVFIKGRGPLLTDVDGNEFIDFVCAHGTALLGHADDRVTAALSKAASKGVAFGAACDLETRLAELFVGRYPGVDLVRLVNTPVEALNLAVLLARHTSGRRRLLLAHGYEISGLDALHPDTNQEHDSLVRVSYNRISDFERALKQHAASLAAVLIEPVGVSAGLIPTADGFLPSLRELCDRYHVLLVFDETATGFRLGSGGAAGRFGVRPDLTVHGPLIGGGMPLSACAGRREVMRLAGDQNLLVQWPPASNNLLALSAGMTTLQVLTEAEVYQTLDAFVSHLKGGLQAAAKHAGIDLQINRATGMLSAFFSSRPVTEAGAKMTDMNTYALFHAHMLEHGIYLPPSPLAPWFLSTAHTAEHIDRTIDAAHEALRLIAGADANPPASEQP